MIGYWTEIGAPQSRHLPRSSSHETTGMLSRQRIGLWHRGQVEGGVIRDCSDGSRRMQTLRKLPKQSPMAATPTASSRSVPTRHFIEQNTRRDRDVERFGALGE